MYNTMFPEDFNSSKHIRDEVINDILFSPTRPLIQNIYNCIPRPYGEVNQKWTKDLLDWDSWKIGALNTAYMFRNNETCGWGQIDSYRRNTMEEQLYKTVRRQEHEIREQNKQIDNLKDMVEKLLSIEKNVNKNDIVERSSVIC